MDCCKDLLSELSGRLQKHPLYQPLEYNIFNLLKVERKEVIMCRFLADLLNPDGVHRCGLLFLRTFLRDVLGDQRISDALLASTEVITEYEIDKERRIDIVIRNSQYFIPIEVKIEAIDQPGQCYDYFQYAKNAPIVYLTKFGAAPSHASRKKEANASLLPLEHIQCISWSEDICGWLTGLLPGLDGPVKPMVEQYIDSIHKFADGQGQSMLEQNVQSILTSPDYFSAGLKLEQAMKPAKLALMRMVFDCFKEEMEAVAVSYGLELETEAQYYSYEHPNHEKFFDRDTTWPGLNYVVKRAKFQANSLQMWFRIEVHHNLFAGLCLFDMAAEPKTGYSKGYQVDDITPALVAEAAQYLNQDVIAVQGDWWLTYCYPNGKRQDAYYSDVPDFKHMNPCAVELVDPKKRLQFVRSAIEVFEAQLLKHLL